MLKLENITKSFEDMVILKNITISFNEGETTVILGTSGSGKSTLLKIIDLLEKPDSGTILFNEFELFFPKKLTFSELRKYRLNFSVVFQSFNLFPHLTVIENIIEGPIKVKKIDKKNAKVRAKSLLKKIGLQDKETVYPKALSGGQMQRVAIARALAMDPQFILYDEPTSALDPELAQEVLKLIQSLSELGNSQIIVTHNIEFAKKVADRIIFIENGSIFFDGKKTDFFKIEEQRIKQFIRKLF